MLLSKEEIKQRMIESHEQHKHRYVGMSTEYLENLLDNYMLIEFSSVLYSPYAVFGKMSELGKELALVESKAKESFKANLCRAMTWELKLRSA